MFLNLLKEYMEQKLTQLLHQELLDPKFEEMQHANIHHAAHSTNSRRQRHRKARRLTQNSRKDYSKTRHPGISKRAFTLKTVTVKWQEQSGPAGCFLLLFRHMRLGHTHIC